MISETQKIVNFFRNLNHREIIGKKSIRASVSIISQKIMSETK